jgi:predicted dehydrogenase
MSRPIGYAVVGAGARGNCLAGYLDRHGDKVFLRAVREPNSEVLDGFLAAHGDDRTVVYEDYRDLLADEAVEWVLVTSPNALHREHIVSAFDAGKRVFAEKPLATSIDDCVAINAAHAAAGGPLFATGFVLRYAPLYRKVKELLDAGSIGRIVSVEANENISASHGGHIMTCWRRFTRYSGSHVLEKCCHDMDLLNWLVGSLPTRVASFGGRDIFIPDNAELMDEFAPPAGEKSIYMGWHDPRTHDADNPFTSDKDVVDHQAAAMLYRNGVTGTFQTVMSCAIEERRMYFSGTEGSLIADLFECDIRLKRLGYGEPTRRYRLPGVMHGGGDERIAASLVESMATGAAPACSGREGLTSAVVSLGIEQSRLEGRMIDLEETWSRLGQ